MLFGWLSVGCGGAVHQVLQHSTRRAIYYRQGSVYEVERYSFVLQASNKVTHIPAVNS